ncbi:MAG: DUF262 domain-containing protein [Pseudolabrys sp.]
MATQRYSVTPHPIETFLTWVKSGEIAIPEIQRPFVWEPVKVRNLLDSLYRGYPIGYLIAWRNPTVRLKDGTPSAGKRILIDGQQRVTALLAAWLILIFASFGFRAPRNAVVVVSFVVSSALIAGALYLILDMDVPFDGTIQVSPAPLARAVAEMER